MLSSVLNRSSRALLLRSSSCSSRSVATVASSSSRASPAICGGRFSRQPLLGRKHTDGLVFGSDIQQQRPVVLQVVYLQQRNFWGWKGGANDKGGKGSEEAGATGVGKKGGWLLFWNPTSLTVLTVCCAVAVRASADHAEHALPEVALSVAVLWSPCARIHSCVQGIRLCMPPHYCSRFHV